LERVIACGQTPWDASDALPFAAYLDPDLFALEQERIFRADWIPVCTDRSLPDAGDHFAFEIAGEPVAIVRGRDGELRALSNTCRHRGTPILDPGFGHAPRLVCPYHSWAFDDTGALLGAPHEGAVSVDPGRHALARFSLEMWCGIVFVHLGPNPKPLVDRLSGLDAMVAEFLPERFDHPPIMSAPEVWNANWKIVLENGLESYHLFKLHRSSLEPALPTRDHYYREGGPEWAVTPGRRQVDAAGSWPGTNEFARAHYQVVGIPPSFYSGLTVEGWALVFVHPVAPDQTAVSTALLLPSGGEAEFAESPFGAETAQGILGEDRAMCERVQGAMRSRAGAPGRLVELERILVDFHHYLADRLGASAQPSSAHQE
jgi:phenylpropionate dioxygenase-like ring-hydroxylating dioxygenase large terminal subunit